MAEIVFFHHALGRTPGFLALTDRLVAAGHLVHTPDLFEGRRFDSIETGMAHVEQLGFDAVVQRGVDAVAGLPDRLVYMGISLGVLPAQRLAQTRAGAAGAVLLEACVPHTYFAPGWPPGVPVQIHGMDRDPFFAGEGDLEAARELVAHAAATGSAELFTYPGEVHYFLDDALPTYDPAAAGQVVERVLHLLESIDGAAAGQA